VRLALPPVALCALFLLAGCGGGDSDEPDRADAGGSTQEAPVLGREGDDEEASAGLGFPVFATSNTTRVGGADAIADAAGVAEAVYPSRDRDTRPRALALADTADWRVAVSAAQLMAEPLRAPLLFSERGELPPATEQALGRLIPTGAKEAGGAQVIRVGEAAAA
jgi:hypothetical protein